MLHVLMRTDTLTQKQIHSFENFKVVLNFELVVELQQIFSSEKRESASMW